MERHFVPPPFFFFPPHYIYLLQTVDPAHHQSFSPGSQPRGGSFPARLRAAVRFSSWFVSVMSPGGLTRRWLFPPGWAVLSRSVPFQLADDSRVSQRAESVTPLAERSWHWLKEHLHNIAAERPDSPPPIPPQLHYEGNITMSLNNHFLAWIILSTID